MNVFDKICAVGAFVIGVVLLGLGGLGLFVGCSANFSLPPILGIIPAFVGWGIVRAVFLAWKPPSPPGDSGFAEPDTAPDPWR